MANIQFSERDKKIIKFVLIKMLSEELEEYMTNKSIIKIFPKIVDFADKYAKELERSILGNEALKNIREEASSPDIPNIPHPHVEVKESLIDGIPELQITIDPNKGIISHPPTNINDELYEEVRKDLKKDDFKMIFDWFTKKFKK